MPTSGLWPQSSGARSAAGVRGSLSALAAKRFREWCLLGVLALGGSLASQRGVLAEEPAAVPAIVAIESAVVDAIAAAEKSVVAIARVKHGERDEMVGASEVLPDPFGRIRSFTPQPRPGDLDFIPNDYASGVIVDKDGLIVTHYHVLGDENDQYYITTANRRVYRARVRAADPRSDLAVLAIEAKNLVPIKFGDASTLKKGHIVISLGNPYAIARDGQVSASWGIVSNLARKGAPSLAEDGRPGQKQTLHQSGTLIQTDAKLNLGTSGGALINLKGEMIGLTTSAAALSGYEQAAGYAVPVDETFRRVVELLKQGREVEYGFLGVRPPLDLDEREILAGKHGMKVGGVVDGTPAQRFGLQKDDIISHINGKPIYDADGLVLQVGQLPVEAKIDLTVERAGQVAPVILKVELAKYPVQGKKIVTTPSPSWRGIRVDYASVKSVNRGLFQRDMGADADNCVLVSEVEQDSPAWKEGLRQDMYITHVGDTKVKTPKEFRTAVAGKSGPIKLRVFNGNGDGRQTTKEIPPGEE